MTKIITKLPITSDDLRHFKDDSLRQMISEAVTALEAEFNTLCEEFYHRFTNNEWILMGNKDVYYINAIFGLMPNIANLTMSYQCGNERYSFPDLDFGGFTGTLPTEVEARRCFNATTSYFRLSSGTVDKSGGVRGGVVFIRGSEAWCLNLEKDRTYRHAPGSDNRWMMTVPGFRFGSVDSPQATAAEAILAWLAHDLVPKSFVSDRTRKAFDDLKTLCAKYKDYINAYGELLAFDKDKVWAAVLAGVDFDFLPGVKALVEASEVKATDAFVGSLKADLLNGDKVRADIDPYDENILIDPNRGHWDLWDYGF